MWRRRFLSTAVPDSFETLVTEALLLDRQFHPDARLLWDALLERADGPDADKVDDVLRGEIATERASRAHQERDWDAVNAFFLEAATCYERAGRPDRAIASAARVQWSKATRGDKDTDAAAVTGDVAGAERAAVADRRFASAVQLPWYRRFLRRRFPTTSRRW